MMIGNAGLSGNNVWFIPSGKEARSVEVLAEVGGTIEWIVEESNK